MNVMVNNAPQKWYMAQWIADAAVLLVAIVWGSSYLTAKTALVTYPVFLFLFMRFTITVLLMLPLAWNRLKEASKEVWMIGGIFGLFLFTIFTLETLGVKYTSATNAGFIISLCVVLVPFVEGIQSKKFPGFALLGVVILSFWGTGLLTLQQGYQFNMGDILILFAALVRAVFMMYFQKLTAGKQMDSAALTIIQLGVVTIFTGVISFTQYDVSTSMMPQSIELWLLILYLAVFGTMFAFFIQLVVIRRTSPSRVGILMGTEPIFAALFGVMLGGEVMTWQSWMGGACILFATYIGRQVEEKKRLAKSGITGKKGFRTK